MHEVKVEIIPQSHEEHKVNLLDFAFGKRLATDCTDFHELFCLRQNDIATEARKSRN